jgi:tetratricopeptide (TPR) repeat protein
MATFGERIDRLGLESRLLTKEELTFYKAIYDQAASEPAERFAIAMARRRAGTIHLKLNELEQARLCFTLATHMLESLAVEKPEPVLAPKYRKTLAEIYVDDAECQAASGDIAAAETSYDASLALLSKLLAKSWDKIDFMVDQAVVWHSRGAMYVRLHRYPEAEADLQRALAIRLHRPNDANESTSWLGSPACETIATWLQLSDVYRATHRSADAVAVLQQALNAYTQLSRYQADIHYREGCAEVFEMLADAYAEAHQDALARDADRKALAAYESLETQYPEIRAYHEKRMLVAFRLSL